jgi:hypothetical protein
LDGDAVSMKKLRRAVGVTFEKSTVGTKFPGMRTTRGTVAL